MVDLNDNDIPAASIKKAIFIHCYQELQEQVAKSKKMLIHKDVDFTQVQDGSRWIKEEWHSESKVKW
jgi:hypothetical protein